MELKPIIQALHRSSIPGLRVPPFSPEGMPDFTKEFFRSLVEYFAGGRKCGEVGISPLSNPVKTIYTGLVSWLEKSRIKQ